MSQTPSSAAPASPTTAGPVAKPQRSVGANIGIGIGKALLLPLRFLWWLIRKAWKWVDDNFVSYLVGRVDHDAKGVPQRARFIHYLPLVYYYPTVFISLAAALCAHMQWVAPTLLMFIWMGSFMFCLVAVVLNLNRDKLALTLLIVVVFSLLSYLSTQEFRYNFLAIFGKHLKGLDAWATPGFYILFTYFMSSLIILTLLHAWIDMRVEADNNQMIEHRLFRRSRRFPVIARSVEVDIKDTFEVAILGAADIRVGTTTGGVRVYANVPRAALGLGGIIENMVGSVQTTQNAGLDGGGTGGASGELAHSDDAAAQST